ncbi:MAG: PspC domain-containing protein [Caldisericaceae bacterium]|nr:PspC domain-containing protein [Caldisericaceae bacterium]
MKCYNDPSRDAVGFCTRCGKGVCPEDAVYIDGKLYCKECAKKVFGGQKRLYRSRTDRSICGVCGGLAKYLKIDSALMRLLWVLLTIFTGFAAGVVAYFVLCAVIPEEPLEKQI